MAERDRPLQRTHQLRREALHPRVGHAGKLIRQQLRGGEQVAQIVIDLRNCETERGEPALLMQHGHEIALHVCELALSNTDLVGARARHDDARNALGIFVEADKAGCQATHRPDKQEMQGEIDQCRGENGEQQ